MPLLFPHVAHAHRDSASLASRESESHAKIALMQPSQIARDGTDLALILTCALILYSLFAGVLQRGLLRKLYGGAYDGLEDTASSKGNERQRISFTYHHVASISFGIILLIGAYPAISFTCGSGTLPTPLNGTSGITIGDILSILVQVYCGYYLFEVTFRSRYISFVALAHHIGLLIIAQTAAVLGSRASKSAEATKEFYLCVVWGAFDIVTEFPLHIVLIIWRIKRRNSRLCYKIACGCTAWVLAMAFTETIITAWLLAQSWAGWQLQWQIITPTIFTLWICTQLYGAAIFLRMARQQRTLQ
ncbi:hypothetical protein JX265_002466 [Neoarthrinium moseri]|uniref:TLC domain-containing protein n=1 Tax=Neoarthrinium moseri TaxID=1658444 RepID=A0A9P9WUY8_9PEZI|nr:uncharacterized protein JN550_000280 [Neoarthrinium moseri]KAI1854827.1 hypothetical protein JX266_000945 [Neoarthrinium moseri]KAI1878098.1 hypothetical protein JN550_000280 [Neoarthrinium moseri]KAI1879512.1 hypothetical protein JX265_002466 [Neoarthrinium moseri]